MTITDYEVQPLFVEPYFRANIGHAISKVQEEHLKNLKMTNNKANLISEDLYVFEDPKFKSIKDAVQEALDLFADKVMGIRQRLYVTQSWSLVNNPGVGMHGHSHSNSIISGSLYFTDLPEPMAGMIFNRHRGYQQIELNPERDRHNLYNTPVNLIVPKKHDLLLFSSSLQHVIQTNMGTQPRYAIAFNTFVKGKLGDYRDVSELVLN